jgi:hypothetical protein
MSVKEERDRILQMVEAGQVSAAQASELFDVLEEEPEQARERSFERSRERRERTLRVRVTNLKARQQKVYAIAALPISVIQASMRLGGQIIPQLNNSALRDLLRAIEMEATGRLLDLQDLERGERLEIFVE